MKRPPNKFIPYAMFGLLLAGCATRPPPAPPDYTNFRQFHPRSILVLPPVGHGTYSYLSTVTRPLAELGYYVFPVAVVDQILKDNGMSSAAEMHEAPLARLAELTGADAVLFLTLKQYGSRYQLDNFSTTVDVLGKLVDTRSGLTLWEGSGGAYEDSQSESESEYDSDKSVFENIIDSIFSDIFNAAVHNAFDGRSDNAHTLCDQANRELFINPGYGLLYGPYHPKYGTAPTSWFE